MGSREATHAGSWYTSTKEHLSQQLHGWLNAVPSATTPIGSVSSQQGDVSIPSQGARAVIAPHAGYSYSGPAAAWAYKAIDWSKAKRVFLLGPSHHHYLEGAATTSFDSYDTPLGELPVDTEFVNEIAQKWGLSRMSSDVDEAEHSLEMHLPYIHKMLSLHFQPADLPLLVPIMIGNTKPATERRLGGLLGPHLSDPTALFIISSDFCHWGSRFRYTYYRPSSGQATMLKANPPSSSRPIHESIAAVDQDSMEAVETGSHARFLEQLEETGNTVCGRHPIGVFMAAVEANEELSSQQRGRFKFVRYERSGLVSKMRDSSVSYCSAFAVF